MQVVFKGKTIQFAELSYTAFLVSDIIGFAKNGNRFKKISTQYLEIRIPAHLSGVLTLGLPLIASRVVCG